MTFVYRAPDITINKGLPKAIPNFRARYRTVARVVDGNFERAFFNQSEIPYDRRRNLKPLIQYQEPIRRQASSAERRLWLISTSKTTSVQVHAGNIVIVDVPCAVHCTQRVAAAAVLGPWYLRRPFNDDFSCSMIRCVFFSRRL